MLKRARFAHMTLLCTVSNLGLSRSGAPPDQILDPPLTIILFLSGYRRLTLAGQEFDQFGMGNGANYRIN